MKYPNIKRNQRDIIQSKTNQNQISNIITIEFMPLLLHRISPPVRFGLCAHSTHPRAGCQTRAKKQSLTQSVRPRKVGSAPGGLAACYRLTAHKKSITCSGTWIWTSRPFRGPSSTDHAAIRGSKTGNPKAWILLSFRVFGTIFISSRKILP